MKEDLLIRVLEALRNAGGRVRLVTKAHPYDLVLEENERRLAARVYIWNLSHGGRPGLPDEYRIQLSGVDRPIEAPQGAQTLVLGWDEGLGVFAAFDPRLHRDAGSNASVQVPLETLQEASASGSASHLKGNSELVLCFVQEALAGYVLNQAEIHGLPDVAIPAETVEALLKGEVLTGDLGSVSEQRKVVLRMVATTIRDARFRKAVLEAYGHACAVCGTQLGLIEAAHIVPVADEVSTDEVSNGLALCALHHRAYDSALIGIREDYAVVLNENRMDILAGEARLQGVDAFREGLGDSIRLPEDLSLHPKADFLARGLAIRGWNLGTNTFTDGG